MNLFTKISVKQKIAVISVFVLLFQFLYACFPISFVEAMPTEGPTYKWIGEGTNTKLQMTLKFENRQVITNKLIDTYEYTITWKTKGTEFVLDKGCDVIVKKSEKGQNKTYDSSYGTEWNLMETHDSEDIASYCPQSGRTLSYDEAVTLARGKPKNGDELKKIKAPTTSEEPDENFDPNNYAYYYMKDGVLRVKYAWQEGKIRDEYYDYDSGLRKYIIQSDYKIKIGNGEYSEYNKGRILLTEIGIEQFTAATGLSTELIEDDEQKKDSDKAKEDAKKDSEVGTIETLAGKLLIPVLDLITTLGEGVEFILQKFILGVPYSVLNINMDDSNGFFSKLGAIVGATGATAGIIAAPFTGGLTLLLVGATVGGYLGSKAPTAIKEFITQEKLPDDFWLPVYFVSPQEIFAGQIPAFGINFIQPDKYEEVISNISETFNSDKEEIENKNSAVILQSTIQTWYVSLRNLALVGLMVVLLYIGIRIVLGATSGEKAKYKERLADWIVAMILVVFMHYIMAFSIFIVDKITELINEQNQYIQYEFDSNTVNKINEAYKKQTGEGTFMESSYPVNLLGYARLEQQLGSRNSKGKRVLTFKYIGYTIIYLVLIIYTVGFAYKYMRRVIYMAFLTLMAPLVALTYPIDKLKDGSAQAFDMWLKEYIYNLLLQPFHLLLYSILIGSAMNLAKSNMLYSLVALGFLMPAEKLLRRFFGFEKASVVGSTMEGAVGGALAMHGINKLRSLSASTGGSGSSKSGGSDSENSDNPGHVRTADVSGDAYDGFRFGAGRGAAGAGAGATGAAEAGAGAAGAAAGVAEAGAGAVATAVGNGARAAVEEGANFGEEDNGANPINLNDEQIQRREELGRQLDDADYNDMYLNPGLYGPMQDEYNQLAHGAEETRGNMDTETGGMADNTSDSSASQIRTSNNRIYDNPGENKQKIKNRPSIRKLKGAGKVGLTYAMKGGKSIAESAPRVVARAALGAGLGIAGIAAGIATGDMSKTVTYGGAGYMAGRTIGNTGANLASRGIASAEASAKNIKEQYENEVYTEQERKALRNQRADEEWLKDKKVQQQYRDKYGKDYKNKMNQAREYRKRGITDDTAIIKAMKLHDSGKIGGNEKFAYAKAIHSVQNDKDLETLEKRLKADGLNDERLTTIKRNIRESNDF